MRTARLAGVLFIIMLFGASPAMGQGGFSPQMMESRDSGSAYRSFGLTMPVITVSKETVVRMEFNLGGQGAIAVEGSLKKKREEVGESKQEETGESLIAEGKGLALFISRYSNGADMSGFYWGLGLGMREENLSWKVSAEKDDPQADYSLTNDKNQFEHQILAKGTTGHLRIGFRYVAQTLPVAAGLYAGARHFQASAEDDDRKKDDQKQYDESKSDPMTDSERDRIKRRIATTPEVGLEFGFAF